VAVIKDNFKIVDKFESLIISGELSYDPEDEGNKNFSYNWKCPSNL
jgi:hypothetical protein